MYWLLFSCLKYVYFYANVISDEDNHQWMTEFIP